MAFKDETPPYRSDFVEEAALRICIEMMKMASDGRPILLVEEIFETAVSCAKDLEAQLNKKEPDAPTEENR